MPWHIVDDHGDCPDSRPWAVVKDADGTVEGCHPTQDDAQAQLAALNAQEENSMGAPREFRRTMPFEVTRADEDGEGLTLEGYAAVFNAPTEINSRLEGHFIESIQRGAFAKTLAERTPVLQFDHGSHPLIGSIPLGVIQFAREDEHGLFVRARLSDNWLIAPVRDAIRDGAVNGMSFRFRAIREDWDDTSDPPHRTLVELAAPELGPVVFPAYEQTEVGVRDEPVNELAARMETHLKFGTSDDAAPRSTSEEAADTDDAPPASGTRRTPAEIRQADRRWSLRIEQKEPA